MWYSTRELSSAQPKKNPLCGIDPEKRFVFLLKNVLNDGNMPARNEISEIRLFSEIAIFNEHLLKYIEITVNSQT